MSIHKNFSVIIVDYGTLQRTEKFIEDFYDACESADDVTFIVVDNFDKDDLPVYQMKFAKNYSQIESFSKWNHTSFRVYKGNIEKCNVYLIKTGKNLGYAKANNIGTLFAIEILQTAYLIFSNNDILFPEKIKLEKFIEIFAEDKQRFVIGPKIKESTGVSQSPAQRMNPYLWFFGMYLKVLTMGKISSTYILSAIPNATSGNYFKVKGCFIVVEAKKFYSVGMFDEATFLYFEEDILGERGLSKGYTCYFCNELSVIHEGEMTTKKKFVPIKVKEIGFRSALYYFKTYRHLNKIVLFLAKWNFYLIYRPLYVLFRPLWEAIK